MSEVPLYQMVKRVSKWHLGVALELKGRAIEAREARQVLGDRCGRTLVLRTTGNVF